MGKACGTYREEKKCMQSFRGETGKKSRPTYKILAYMGEQTKMSLKEIE